MDGRRLSAARMACGLSQSVLASLAGISQGTVSKAEKGMAALSPAQIQAVSSAIGFPASFFSDEPFDLLANGLFRKASRASAALQKEVEAKVSLIAEAARVADERYRLLNVTVRPSFETADEGAAMALGVAARPLLGVPPEGPVPNVTRSLERGGVVVAQLPGYAGSDGSKRLDGYSAWPHMGEDGRRPVVVTSAFERGDVLRATVAHELGHLVLHTRFPGIEKEAAERQAWAFANGFLLPPEEAEAAFGGDPVTPMTLLRAKSVYGVSAGFIVMCLKRYGIVSEERASSLQKQISSRGWRSNEPVDVDLEKPSLLPRLLGRMIDDGIEVGMPPILIRQLMATGQDAPARRKPAAVLEMRRQA